MDKLIRLQGPVLALALGVAAMFPLVALLNVLDWLPAATAFSLVGGLALTALILLALAAAGLLLPPPQRQGRARLQAVFSILVLLLPLALLLWHQLGTSLALE